MATGCRAHFLPWRWKWKSPSRVWLFVTPWTVSRLKYWSRQPFPSPGDLPSPGIKPRSPALQVDSLPAEPQGKPISYPKKPCNLQSQTISGLSDHVVYPQNENFSSLPTFRVDYLQTCFSKFCTLSPAVGSSSVCVCVCCCCCCCRAGADRGAGSGARLFRVGPELAVHIRISSVFTKLKPPKERYKRNSSKGRAEHFWDTKELFQSVQFQWSVFYFDDTSLFPILSQICVLKFTSKRVWESTGKKAFQRLISLLNLSFYQLPRKIHLREVLLPPWHWKICT